ncbi:MAG TPA: aminomethyltransferase family protein [Candidatus Limnocylindria bacterium]|nr:aminomethyltransferase family protein [Candidatus Limnocylindria bacterium]
MAKRSTLNDLHERRGATFVEKDGWLLPDHFGDPPSEYGSVRQSAGLFDLANRAMLQFTGADRLPYLQGMLSNDVMPLKVFDGQQAAILTQQGKVVADVRVLCSLNSLYLDFWEPLKEQILAHLNRFLVADEVEIHDPNEQWKMLSLQGPRAQAMLRQLFANAEMPAQANQHGMVQFDDTPVCVVRADRTGYQGFDLIVQTSHLLVFAQRLNALGAAWVGEWAQNILRVEAGIPRYGVDFSEDNLLLEVALDDAVSFTKGCYLGQEVVERIRSRGHVNKKLCGLLLDGDTPASPGDKLSAGAKEVGQITSSVASIALHQPIALGYVNRDCWTPGTKLTVHHDGGDFGATVTARPIVAPAQPGP